MNQPVVKIALLVVLFAAQWAVPGSLIWKHERTISEGTAYRFRTAPVDPYDAFRGRYVRLDFADRQYLVEPGHNWQGGQGVYVLVETDEDGFARIAGISNTEPDSQDDWFATTIQWRASDQVHIVFPFNRFYMKETLAQSAEDAYNSAVSDREQEAWAVVRVRGGIAVLEDVYLNGKPIAAHARESAASR